MAVAGERDWSRQLPGFHQAVDGAVYEISEELKSRHMLLSPAAVREVLKEEGFAPLPRRLDEERPFRLGPTAEPIADVRSLSLAPRTVTTSMPDLIRLGLDELARAAHLPGSSMIPAEHACVPA